MITNFNHFFIVMSLGVGSVVIGELISSLSIFSAEINRKIFHTLACAIIASFVFFDLNLIAVTIILLSFVLVNIVLRHYRLLTVLNSVKRESYGEFYLLLAGIACMAIANSWQSYFVAFIVLAICDSLAAIVGQNRSIPDGFRNANGKTLKGSIAFFVSCMAIIFGFAYSQNINFDVPVFLYLLGVSAVLALAEQYSSKGIDNFVIPLITVVLLDRIYA